MSAFIRRYLFDPGTEVLLEIESVNILDLEPPARITGVGSNVGLIVGEFEDGPYKTATEVAGGQDLVATFGEFGYRQAGIAGYYPCAQSRKADSAVEAEAWNGNGFIQLQGKRFARLVVCRVDTSVGSVLFRRRAFLTGAATFGYNMEPGQVVSFAKSDGTTSTATFDAAAAVYTSAAGTGYPSGFAGGEFLILGYDDKPDVTVTFTAADQTQVQVMDRINAKMGFSFATQGSSTTTVFTGVKRGKQGEVRIVGGTGSVLTKMGLTVTTVLGTGDVGDIDSVKFDEIRATVEADVNWVKVEQDQSGRLRFSTVYSDANDVLTVASITATALGLTAGQHTTLDGSARLVSGAGTYPTAFAGGETLSVQIDGGTPQTVTFTNADLSQPQVLAKINSVLGADVATTVSATRIRLTGKANGGSIRIIGGTALVKLGLTAGTITAIPATAASIPAGTLVSDSTGTRLLLTTKSTPVGARATGPFEIPVRHAVDDGSGTQFLAGAVVSVPRPISSGSFTVENLFLVTAALNENQIDARYQDAFNATLNANNVSASVSSTWSARQSNACRRMVRDNVLRASASGLQGRYGVVRPPLNTPKAVAKSRNVEPGVGATADQRVTYCYPQAALVIPQITQRGALGGFGFSDDGMTDIGADGFLVSILTQLPPEEDPGQKTEFLGQISSLERGANVSNAPLEIEDYIAFKAAGICALRFDGGDCTFQSAVTSVDPQVQSSLVNINRRRMADFIQDTMARRLKNFGKRLSTVARRRAIAGEIRAYLDGLLGKKGKTPQRIFGYTLDVKTGNTVELIQAGLYRLIVNVRTLSSLKAFALAVTVGEQVEVEEFIPALAA